MPFLNAFFLGGLALASVPVIIHLLNRRRFQRVDWAPMKYLKLTIKTNRRRLRFEQLLLLALRTLAIVVLVLAVARPLLSASGATWLPGRERTSRIVVLDTSLSMAYLDAGRPALDAAKQAATQLLGGQNTRDLATVLTTGGGDALVREAALDSTKVADAIKSVAATDTRTDWPATFRRIDSALSTATFPSKEVVLVTDLRQSGWADVSTLTSQWAAAGVKLRVIDVGTRQTANVALIALDMEQRIALANEPVRLRAQVRNDTPAPIVGAAAVFTVGDEAVGRTERPVQLPDLPAGQTVDVPLTFTPTAAGPLPVRFALAADGLPRDDARDLVVDVKPTLTAALVDGRPSARPFESATDFLTLAFSLGASPWNVIRTPEPEWNAARGLDPADVYVLADVAAPSAARATELERLVRNGAALMIFAGDQMDLSLYNDRLAALLPARLTGVVDAPATGLVIEPQQASPLESLGRVAPAALARVQTKKFMGTQPAVGAEGVRVLARWNTSEAPPAVIEKRVGLGTVVLWLTTADKAWGDWPLDPTYVLAVRSAVTATVRDDTARNNAAVGPPVTIDPGDKAAVNPTVRLPGGETVVPLTRDKAIVLEGTTVAGVYRFAWTEPQGQTRSRLVAATADRAESDLRPVTDDELAAHCGALAPSILHYTGAASLADRGRELWRALAMTALGMFVVEMVLATWVGRQR